MKLPSTTYVGAFAVVRSPSARWDDGGEGCGVLFFGGGVVRPRRVGVAGREGGGSCAGCAPLGAKATQASQPGLAYVAPSALRREDANEGRGE